MVSPGSENKLAWRKASRCDGGACVEVAKLHEAVVVRNSVEPAIVLLMGNDEWQRFLAVIKEGAFQAAIIQSLL